MMQSRNDYEAIRRETLACRRYRAGDRMAAILTISQFKAGSVKYREVFPVYIKDYVSLEKFAA